MLKLLATILVTLALIEASPSRPKIVGGTPAAEGKFPFSAAILSDGHGKVYCGASIIDESHLLTSGLCIAEIFTTEVTAYVGSVYRDGNGTDHSVVGFVIHPKFNMNTMENDIAIITLGDPISLGGDVQPFNFPINVTVSPGDNATVIGWGTLSFPDHLPDIEWPNQMQELTGQIIDSQDCAAAFNSDIYPGQICMGADLGHGSCVSDYGSPLVYYANNQSYLIGVSSWKNASTACGKGYPDVYTDVSHYWSWIQEILNS